MFVDDRSYPYCSACGACPRECYKVRWYDKKALNKLKQEYETTNLRSALNKGKRYWQDYGQTI